MAKFTKRIVLALWVLSLCISTLGVAAYAANAPVSATIQVNTALSGDLPDTPENFTVELTADDPSYPMPKGTKDGVYTLTLKGAASKKLLLSFDRVGDYCYTVKQHPGANDSCYYDPGVYHIAVHVTNGNREQPLQVTVVLTREGVSGKQEEIVFRNGYPQTGPVTLGATVTLDGETPESGAFSFILKDEKGTVLQRVKNNGRDVAFLTLDLPGIGTYTYTMLQLSGDDPGIIYDKTQYTVVITVENDANGDRQIQVVYKLGDTVVEGEPHFDNKTESDIPQTGDGSNPGLWFALLLISGSILVADSYFRKRKASTAEAGSPVA